MMMNRKLVGGIVGVITLGTVGCSSAPTLTPMTTTTNPTTQQVAPSDTESSLTAQELGMTGQRQIQQVPFRYGYRYTYFNSPRCRWYWVPSTWGDNYDQYDEWWDNGRWVLICGRRYIPWWWYGGDWYGPGAFSVRPHHRPRFPHSYYGGFRHRPGGGMGYGGMRPGMRPGGDDDDRGGGGGPRMRPGGDDEGGGGGGMGPRGPRGGGS